MKKLIALTIVCSLFVAYSSGQVLSITGFGGYTFNDKVHFANSYGYINAGGHWGISLEGIDPEGHAIELLFQQMPTHSPMYTALNIKLNPDKDNLTISYIMLNGVMYHKVNPMFYPYVGLGIGVGIISSNGEDALGNPYSETQTRFGWNTKVGVKIRTKSPLGFKFQAQLFSILQASGGGFFVGEGAYSGYTGSYASIWQFGFSGGICYDLQKKH
ncbi:MAG: hypothetical protein C5B59_05175 [Bacteroidetes bacterium]|nr:MAG: hypothetical protein C5B59_05175 [Bacteroidota bacterium]